MKKLIILGIAALMFSACSSNQSANPLGTGFRNLMAYNCANGQTILGQVPSGLLTPAQIQMAADGVCSAVFGTVAAPAPAAGNMPMFPGAPAIIAPSVAVPATPAK